VGARAGLKAGDVIRTVDDRPAADIGLQSFQALLKGAIGTRILLKLAEGDAPSTIELAEL
jgi:C-terminal processing protease CtpA/Prc